MTDPLRNPKDPLHKSGPDAGKELFRTLSPICHGFDGEAIMDAAFNLVINMIRQSKANWRDAEALFDERLARSKTALRDQYDANGKRRNVFPFHQHITVDHVSSKNKF